MTGWLGKWFAAALGAVLALSGTAAAAETILFVGNSFTFGAYSPVWHYRADSVTDLNGEGSAACRRCSSCSPTRPGWIIR